MPRYIDAEVLRTEINGLRISGLGNKPPEWHDAMWKCLNIILETPTADKSTPLRQEPVSERF